MSGIQLCFLSGVWVGVASMFTIWFCADEFAQWRMKKRNRALKAPHKVLVDRKRRF